MEITTIGVVGAGTMGSGIAQVFAQAGFSVRLVDVADPLVGRARRSVEKSLDTFVKKNKLSSEDRDAALGRLTTATALDRLVEADYIVEAIVENVHAKRGWFTSLDRIAGPRAILASQTSALSITLLGAAHKRRGRGIGQPFMH